MLRKGKDEGWTTELENHSNLCTRGLLMLLKTPALSGEDEKGVVGRCALSTLSSGLHDFTSGYDEQVKRLNDVYCRSDVRESHTS